MWGRRETSDFAYKSLPAIGIGVPSFVNYVHIYCSNRSTNRCFFSHCIGFRVHSYALLLPMFLFNGPRVSQSLYLTHSWLKTRVLAQFRRHCHSNEAECMRKRNPVTFTSFRMNKWFLFDSEANSPRSQFLNRLFGVDAFLCK